MSNLCVYKSNDLIDASYKLNTQAQKLIIACLASVDSRGDIPKKTTITVQEYSQIMGINSKNAYRDLYKAADCLFEAEITIKQEGNRSRLRWVQESVQSSAGEGSVTLEWSDKVLKYISNLKTRFTSYDFDEIAKLKSSHSIRIYEMLMRFKSTGERLISLDDFKCSLGIVDKYKDYKDLNKRVISPALKEINNLTNVSVKMKKITERRAVKSLKFTFTINRQEALPDEKLATESTDAKYSDEFETLWKYIPKRDGTNSKAAAYKSINARLKEGVSWEDMTKCLARYIEYCKRNNKINTQYVMQMSRFFGAERHYESEWLDVPAQQPQRKMSPSQDYKSRMAGMNYGFDD